MISNHQFFNFCNICSILDLAVIAFAGPHEALPFQDRYHVRQGIPDLCRTVHRLRGSCAWCHVTSLTFLARLPESTSVSEYRHGPAVPLSISTDDPLVLLAVDLPHHARCSSRVRIPKNI